MFILYSILHCANIPVRLAVGIIYCFLTGMAGKDDLANAVLGGASDYVADIGTIFTKLFFAPNDEERVSVLILLTT